MVAQVIKHPSYVAIPTHDIVLLRLNNALTFTDYVTPVCLTEEADEPDLYGSDSCYVAGWGITEVGSAGKSPQPSQFEFAQNGKRYQRRICF